MDDLHASSYLSQEAFFVFAEINERCEVRHKFPTRAQLFPSGDNQLCWTHPGQLRRRVEAHHCDPTSTRWPPGYSIPFSSFSLTQRVIMFRRACTKGPHHQSQGKYAIRVVLHDGFGTRLLFSHFSEIHAGIYGRGLVEECRLPWKQALSSCQRTTSFAAGRSNLHP